MLNPDLCPYIYYKYALYGIVIGGIQTWNHGINHTFLSLNKFKYDAVQLCYLLRVRIGLH